MCNADFWIKKIPQPNKVILTPKNIEKLNSEIKGVSDDEGSECCCGGRPTGRDHSGTGKDRPAQKYAA